MPLGIYWLGPTYALFHHLYNIPVAYMFYQSPLEHIIDDNFCFNSASFSSNN